MSAHGLKMLLLKVLIVMLSVTALLAIVVIIVGTDDDLTIRLLVTSVFLALFSLTGLCAGIGLERGWKVIGTTGIAASVLAAGYTILLIWEVLPADELGPVKPAFVLGMVAGAMGYSSLVLISHGKSARVDLVVFATVGLVMAIAALLIGVVVTESEPQEWFGRLLGVLGILTVLGTLLAPILNKVAALQATSSGDNVPSADHTA